MDKLSVLSKALRKKPTDAEKLLWQRLRLRQMEGFKFRRQQPIDKYIADFACFENRVIIEADGGQHAINKEQDVERDDYLRLHGFKVLRFWNNDILHPPLTPPVKGGEVTHLE